MGSIQRTARRTPHMGSQQYVPNGNRWPLRWRTYFGTHTCFCRPSVSSLRESSAGHRRTFVRRKVGQVEYDTRLGRRIGSWLGGFRKTASGTDTAAAFNLKQFPNTKLVNREWRLRWRRTTTGRLSHPQFTWSSRISHLFSVCYVCTSLATTGNRKYENARIITGPA